MKSFEFTIIASGLDREAPDFEQRFYDAGCDDATVSFQKGHIILDFARAAESAEAAIVSAIAAVAAAGATIERIEPDPLVSLADIAGRAGLTRAAVTQYAKGQRGKAFPPPVAKVTSDSPLWDWATVARWLAAHDRISRDDVLEAFIIKKANEALMAGTLPAEVPLRQQAHAWQAQV